MYDRGFTLIEIMVVMGIFIVLVSFGTIVDLNVLKSDTLRAEEATIVSLLSKARSRSMSNMFGVSHGICYSSGNYIIFRNGTCAISSTSEAIPANTNLTISFSPSSIIFSQLSGNTPSGSVNVTDGIKTEIITINNEGTINW